MPGRRACTSWGPTVSGTRRLPHGAPARPGGRVLRRPGHHLAQPADPRGRHRGPQDRPAATYELPYDGDRLRLVAWRTPKGAYWISNTLLLNLDEGQMLAIARSVRRSRPSPSGPPVIASRLA